MGAIMKEAELVKLLAQRIWSERDRLTHVETNERTMRHAALEYPVALTLPGYIRITLDHGNWTVKVDMAGHPRKLDLRRDSYCLLRTWRAVQTMGMIEAMGHVEDPQEIAIGRLSMIDKMRIATGGTPKRSPGQNAPERLDEILADRIAAGGYVVAPERKSQNGLKDIEGNWFEFPDIAVSAGKRFTLDGDVRHVFVEEKTWGNVLITGSKTLRAMDMAQSGAHASALGLAGRARIYLPATGNARIARIARLCRTAVEMEPDLVDSRGTAIRPLIEKHLPDLLRKHAATAAVAPAEQMAAIDADLDRGVEIIRIATEDALARLADDRREDLLTQLRFLEARHPTAVAV